MKLIYFTWIWRIKIYSECLTIKVLIFIILAEKMKTVLTVLGHSALIIVIVTSLKIVDHWFINLLLKYCLSIIYVNIYIFMMIRDILTRISKTFLMQSKYIYRSLISTFNVRDDRNLINQTKSTTCCLFLMRRTRLTWSAPFQNMTPILSTVKNHLQTTRITHWTEKS